MRRVGLKGLKFERRLPIELRPAKGGGCKLKVTLVEAFPALPGIFEACLALHDRAIGRSPCCFPHDLLRQSRDAAIESSAQLVLVRAQAPEWESRLTKKAALNGPAGWNRRRCEFLGFFPTIKASPLG